MILIEYVHDSPSVAACNRLQETPRKRRLLARGDSSREETPREPRERLLTRDSLQERLLARETPRERLLARGDFSREETPRERTLLARDSLRERLLASETPCKRLLARETPRERLFVRETPPERLLFARETPRKRRHLARGDSLQETPRKRFLTRDFSSLSREETPCERLLARDRSLLFFLYCRYNFTLPLATFV